MKLTITRSGPHQREHCASDHHETHFLVSGSLEACYVAILYGWNSQTFTSDQLEISNSVCFWWWWWHLFLAMETLQESISEIRYGNDEIEYAFNDSLVQPRNDIIAFASLCYYNIQPFYYSTHYLHALWWWLMYNIYLREFSRSSLPEPSMTNWHPWSISQSKLSVIMSTPFW